MPRRRRNVSGARLELFDPSLDRANTGLVDDAWYEVTLTKLSMFKTVIDLAGDGVQAAGGETTPAGARLAGMRDFYAFVRERLPQLIDEWAAAKPLRHDSR